MTPKLFLNPYRRDINLVGQPYQAKRDCVEPSQLLVHRVQVGVHVPLLLDRQEKVPETSATPITPPSDPPLSHSVSHVTHDKDSEVYSRESEGQRLCV